MNETPMQARCIVAEALRSGEYKQGKYRLEQVVGDETLNCCLGVACREYIKAGHELKVEIHENKYERENYTSKTSFDGEEGILPKKVSTWLGFKSQSPLLEFPIPKTFPLLNDTGTSFEKIAKAFEDPKIILTKHLTEEALKELETWNGQKTMDKIT